MKGEVKKVVLAYSGGLDTSVILKWLKNEYGCDVIAFTARGPREASARPRSRQMPTHHPRPWRGCWVGDRSPADALRQRLARLCGVRHLTGGALGQLLDGAVHDQLRRLVGGALDVTRVLTHPWPSSRSSTC